MLNAHLLGVHLKQFNSVVVFHVHDIVHRFNGRGATPGQNLRNIMYQRLVDI